VTDNQMKGRATVTLNGATTQDTTPPEHPLVAPNPGPPNQALQVLAMAQRTAEEHVSSAHRQADKIRADAMAAAEQTARDVEVHAQNVRREADKMLAEARAAAEQAAREAQTRMKTAQRDADKIVSEAQAQAEATAAKAEQNAEELQLQAERRYDDVVGSLGARREALQQQIEALERFDREYRARLTAFMQGQLRALWVDQPQVTGEPDQTGPELSEESVLPEQRNSVAPNASLRAQRHRAEPATDSGPVLSEH
jgi:cell division septum initiation protein DivIVA